MTQEKPGHGILRRGVQYVYDTLVRERLPRKIAVMNGVAVRNRYLFDTVDVAPDFQKYVVDAIQEYVDESDDVTILGGGSGVSAVHAARQGATVTVYEGAEDRARQVEETARLNDVAGQVEVVHAVVGEGKDVWGVEGPTVSPAELSPCDHLEIDIEGAEVGVLRELEIRPSTVVVEVHLKHVEVETVDEILDDYGYDVVSKDVERPDEAVLLTAERGEERD